MRFKVNKAALSVATAVMMVTSMFTMLGTSASAANEIKLTADRSAAKVGERINISVGYEPGETGASGMTLNLHYDPDKVAVHIPTAQEADTVYNVPSSFSVITNYSYSEGIVRIVGANLMNTNIDESTDLSYASFDVLKNAEGSIDFWIEVETMVSATDTGFVQSAYMTVPVSVDGPAPVTVPKPVTTTTVTTTAKPVTTTPKATTTPAPTTTTSAPATTTTVTTTTTTTPAATTTTKAVTTTEATTTTAKVTTTTKAPETTTTTAATTTTKATTTKKVTTTPPATTTQEVTTVPEVTEPENNDPKDIGEPLFFYHQEGGDFNSETDVSYRIKVKDYVDDYTKSYDIVIKVEATANANGGVGMILDGKYQKQNERLRTGGEEDWVIEDIVPSRLGSDLVVALYYLKNNADFSVNSVAFVETDVTKDAPDPVLDEVPDEDDNAGDEQENAETGSGDDADTGDEEEADADTADGDGEDAENKDNNTEAPENDNNEGGTVTDGEGNTAESDGEDATVAGEDGVDGTAIGEEQENPGSSETTGTGDTSAEATAVSDANEIEEAVVHASQQAGSSSANPSTGESHHIRNLLMIVSGGYILWSLAAVIISHRTRKKEN